MQVKVLVYFNSIKVRLKLSSKQVQKDLQEFQFHKGTIKTHVSALKYMRKLISIP